MNKKILSFFWMVAMILCLLPVGAFAADETAHTCDSSEGAYCIVCDLADKINALPDAEEITVENATEVTDQLHAIDRLKVELTDEQYDELLTLVERDNDGSGYGTDVPVKYMNAVEKVQTLGGNSLMVVKKFSSADGSVVNVDNAEVVFEVTNTDTNASQTITMTTMDYIPNSLSANADFYSTDGSGWTYKYILPAGTYQIKEVSDKGAVVKGEEFVTTEVTYNGTVSDDGITVNLTDGSAEVTVLNSFSPSYTVDFVDRDGNAILVDGYYGISVTDDEGYITNETKGEFTGVSTYEMVDLEDGTYQISFNSIAGNGYYAGGFIEFKVKNGSVVIEYDAEGTMTTPYSVTHIVRDVTAQRMTVEIASILYDFQIGVVGLDGALPFEVKDSEGNPVAWYYIDETAEIPECGGLYLVPGDYKFYSLVDETFTDLINFPAENECVEFTINEDYTITVNSDNYDTNIDDFGDSYMLTWYLEPKSSVTITASISTDDGTGFPDGTQVILYVEDSLDEETGEILYSEVKRLTLPTDVNEYSVSWSVAASHLEYDETDGENVIVENSYAVKYMNFDGEEFEFENVVGNEWTATIAGKGAEFETLSDTGYYASTSESEDKVGVIALNVLIKNFTYIQNSIVKYGAYISTDSELETSVYSAESSSIQTLINDLGYYHTILKNIAQESFGTAIFWQPFVIVDTDGNAETTDDQRIMTGEILSTSVWEGNKWFGSDNPYTE